jgi:magnesium chelatase subunit H
MDGTHARALTEAAARLQRDHNVPVSLVLYDAPRLRTSADFARLNADLQTADFVFGSMLFGEEFIRPLQPLLAALTCPVCVITSNPALIRTTQLGKFCLRKANDETKEPGLLQQWMHKLRPRGGSREGHRQLALINNLGKVLKFIPGKARDLHTYIVAHQYWLHGSAENVYRLLCLLITRYLPSCQTKLPMLDPIEYPNVALLHPKAPAPFASLGDYQKWQKQNAPTKAKNGTVGLLSLRTVALSGNTAHLDALHNALEARGLEVRMAYSAGLDFRPAITQFFSHQYNKTTTSDVDLLLNGAGFSLIGGMAESRPDEARATLETLDVGYLDMIPLAFQRVEDWQDDYTGLSPIQIAMNIAVPELDGAAEPLVYGGPSADSDQFVAVMPQIELAADRIARRVALRRTPNSQKRLAVVLFNFPPNLGNIGTAAYLDVFASLYAFMQRLAAEGYAIDLPASLDDLRQTLVEGNSQQYGTDGNLATHLSLHDYRRLFPAYQAIEPVWGTAPGELLNDGQNFQILGAQFGQLFVGLQPSFGYERDPMRLLMAKDAAPHHGFAAFYTWIDKVFQAHAVVHFGTHGALEFMPGKQVGMTTDCWPTRLLGGLPNFYYYCVNNPSEATIAKRRGAATTISYLTPPLQNAGLYKGLRLLKDAIDSYHKHPNPTLLDDLQLQAERLGITIDETEPGRYVAALSHELIQVEERMIPIGLHVLGQTPGCAELIDTLTLVATFVNPQANQVTLPRLVAHGLGYEYEALRDSLAHDSHAQQCWTQVNTIVHEAIQLLVVNQYQPAAADRFLQQQAGIRPSSLAALWHYLGDLAHRMGDEQELHGLVHALAGGFIPPSPANDVVRNPAVVPTGRNLHGLDPFRVPSAVAQEVGTRLTVELLERLTTLNGQFPETVALVLWGTDNLKSDGEGVAQALALLGARVLLDELGKVCDVELIPLSELKRPRVDVVVTVSGIFRDLLSHQMLLIDKAAKLAAQAAEPSEFNFVRKHALAQAAELHIPLHEAATRVFSNAPGSYGANVNHLVESGTWDDDSQLANAFVERKSFAFGPNGEWREARAVLEHALTTVDATFQNIDSFEVGINDIDHYYEYLGGITKSVEKLRGQRPPVMVAEALASTGRLSTLEQMVRLETRAKLLNPKWYEGMLAHGYQGVREIETRVGNTYGWSATTDAVEGWVYQGVAETYLLDEQMLERMAHLNAHATAAVTRRLLEANARGFWDADENTLQALQAIYADLEDRLEGVMR